MQLGIIYSTIIYMNRNLFACVIHFLNMYCTFKFLQMWRRQPKIQIFLVVKYDTELFNLYNKPIVEYIINLSIIYHLMF